MLPMEARDWPRERARVVLLHELSHISRWDYLTQVTARAACSLHWFNPLAWLGLRKMLALREQACDDSVLYAGARASEYAEHIVDIARSARATRVAAAAILMARSPRIERRLTALLDPASVRRVITMKDSVLCACVALCIVLPLSAATLAAAQAPAAAKVVEPAAAASTPADTPAIESTTPRVESSAPPAAPVGAGATTLKHDDGRMDGKLSIGASGHSVQFVTPPGKWYLTTVEVYGSRYGQTIAPKEDWIITVCDKDMKAIASVGKPYSTFERGTEKWYRVRVPALELPQGPFWVNLAFNTHKTKGVYVGIDKPGEGDFSRMGLPDQTPEPGPEGGSWMIRIVVSPKPVGGGGTGEWQQPEAPPASTESLGLVEMKNDDGKSNGKLSISGEGPAARFEGAPEGGTLERLRIYGSRYGSGYDTKKTTIDYYILDAEGRSIATGRIPYGLFTYDEKWVDVPMGSAKVPSTFWVFLNPFAHQYKGIYWHYDTDVSQTHSKVGSIPEDLRELERPWEWMIRAYVKPADAAK